MIDLGNGIVIKPREIVISVGIIALMTIFGLGISNVIHSNADDRNDELEMAIIIKSPEMLEYCLETKVGNTFMDRLQRPDAYGALLDVGFCKNRTVSFG